MSDINLLSPSSIKGLTRNLIIPSTFGIGGNIVRNVELLPNLMGSGKLLKINELSIYNPGLAGEVFIDNQSSNAFKVNIDVNNYLSPNNIAPTDTKFIFDTITTGGQSGRWTVIDKNNILYIQEGQTLRYDRICFIGGQQANLVTHITISYEEIS